MPRIWIWSSDKDDYAKVAPVADEDLDAFGAVPAAGRVIRVEEVSKGRHRPPGDCPYTGLAQPKLLSDRALEVLQDLLSGELREVEFVGHTGRFWMFYPTTELDVLDVEKSRLTRSGSRFVQLIEPKFLDKEINSAVFSVPEFRGGKVFVTEKFRERIVEGSLRGFELCSGEHVGATVWRS